MGFSDGWTSTKGALDGFFGSVIGGVSDGVGSTIKEVIPNWAADQLNVQRTDQLRDDTFNPINAGQSIVYMPPDMQNTGWFGDDTYNSNMDTKFVLLLVGGCVIMGVVLGKVL